MKETDSSSTVKKLIVLVCSKTFPLSKRQHLDAGSIGARWVDSEALLGSSMIWNDNAGILELRLLELEPIMGPNTGCEFEIKSENHA